MLRCQYQTWAEMSQTSQSGRSLIFRARNGILVRRHDCRRIALLMASTGVGCPPGHSFSHLAGACECLVERFQERPVKNAIEDLVEIHSVEVARP
jgi:hypothetical protein